MTQSKLRIGISGWTYPDWRGPFYPDALTIKQELPYASRTFNSIEVNGTFYALQRAHTFEKWYQEAPAGFEFAIKAPKYITHERRLKDVETPMANFFASGMFCLKEKLGPILWQLPPNLPFDAERIEAFLKLLPHNTQDAAKLAEKHSDWMKERAFYVIDESRPLLHALEVRHHSFQTPQFISLMRQYRIAIVIGDTAGRWPLIEEKTSDLCYIRLHGDETIYPEGYTTKALELWAQKLSQFAVQYQHVYAFCDNDHKTAAPANGKELMQILGMQWRPEPLPEVRVKAKKAASKKTPARKISKEKKKTSAPAANNRAVRKPARGNRAKNKPLNKVRKLA